MSVLGLALAREKSPLAERNSQNVIFGEWT